MSQKPVEFQTPPCCTLMADESDSQTILLDNAPKASYGGSSIKPPPIKKGFWASFTDFFSSAETKAAKLTAQELSDQLCEAIYEDHGVSRVIELVKAGARLNAPGRVQGRGVAWGRDAMDFCLAYHTEGAVPATPLHFAALKDRHAMLLLLTRLGANRHATIKLRVKSESKSRELTPYDLVNWKGLSPNAEMLEPPPKSVAQKVSGCMSCCCCCCCCCGDDQ